MNGDMKYFNNMNYIGSYAYNAFETGSGLVHIADNMMGARSLWAHMVPDHSRDQNRIKGSTYQFFIW